MDTLSNVYSREGGNLLSSARLIPCTISCQNKTGVSVENAQQNSEDTSQQKQMKQWFVLRKDLKQQEQQKTNVKEFIAAVKKYTDLQELDAAVLRAFIDRIEVSHVDKKSRTREIAIVYNFIGAFDFTRAIENARNTSKKEQRTA